jgi:hypothetical protein
MKTLKNAPTCLDHYSDHLQGARRFFVKVTGFKSFYKFFKIVKVICGVCVSCVGRYAVEVICGNVAA